MLLDVDDYYNKNCKNVISLISDFDSTRPKMSDTVTHYENTPMQYMESFSLVKIEKFSTKKK